jgi:hypothetical protein
MTIIPGEGEGRKRRRNKKTDENGVKCKAHLSQ